MKLCEQLQWWAWEEQFDEDKNLLDWPVCPVKEYQEDTGTPGFDESEGEETRTWTADEKHEDKDKSKGNDVDEEHESSEVDLKGWVGEETKEKGWRRCPCGRGT